MSSFDDDVSQDEIVKNKAGYPSNQFWTIYSSFGPIFQFIMYPEYSLNVFPTLPIPLSSSHICGITGKLGQAMTLGCVKYRYST